jgi:HK97 family phage portal protein
VGKLAQRLTASQLDIGSLSPLSPGASWFLNAFAGGPTAAGIHVTPDTALRNAAVYRCVELLSSLPAFLPLQVYRRHPSGVGADAATDHPNHNLLFHQPHDWQVSYQWRQAMGTSLFLRGNAYSAVVWNKDGTIDKIIFLHPDRVQVYVDQDGIPVYRVRAHPVLGPWVWLSRFEMHHFWVNSTNGYIGVGPIEANRETVGLAQGAEEYGARLMSNGGQISGVLSLPPGVSKEVLAAGRMSWEEAHQGVGQAHRTAVLPGEIKFTPIQMTSVDAQWLEMRKFSVEDIGRLFGVPADFLNLTGHVQGGVTGVEQRFLSFLATRLDPVLVAWEQCMQRDFFTPDERDSVYPRFHRAALLRTDLLTRYRAWAIGRQWGWLTANNVLGFEEMNPIGGDAGNTYLDPMNMARISGAGGTAGDLTGLSTVPEAALDERIMSFIRQALADGGLVAAGGNGHG